MLRKSDISKLEYNDQETLCFNQLKNITMDHNDNVQVYPSAPVGRADPFSFTTYPERLHAKIGATARHPECG